MLPPIRRRTTLILPILWIVVSHLGVLVGGAAYITDAVMQLFEIPSRCEVGAVAKRSEFGFGIEHERDRSVSRSQMLLLVSTLMNRHLVWRQVLGSAHGACRCLKEPHDLCLHEFPPFGHHGGGTASRLSSRFASTMALIS